MKESLFDIFSKHTNWEDLNNGERYIEMKQAANIYGDSLLSFGDRWIKAVEYDIDEICRLEPPHTHFNKDRQTNYRISVFDFLLIIRNALESHGFVINELDHVTQWKLGVKGNGIQIEDGLSRDEAGRLYNKLKKQGFRVRYYRELCSNFYTVIGYQVEASPGSKRPEKKQLDKSKNIGRPKSETFIDFIKDCKKDDADFLIFVLNELFIEGKRSPTLLAKLIIAITDYWINEPSHISVCKEFGLTKITNKDGKEYEEANSAYTGAINKHYHNGNEGKYKNSRPFSEIELKELRSKIDLRVIQLKEGKTKKNPL